MVIFKLYTFKTHHNRIVKLTEAIYEPLDFLHQSSDVRIKKILKRTAFYENLTDKFSEILAIMFDFALISSLIINSGSLPVRGAFPFDTSILPFYALAVTIQIGTACITLTSVSNSITHGLWSSSWEKSLSSNVKSIMIMTMTLAKNQLQINAGKFFVMSLETFITVIRTAYSFFVLLSSLNTD
ncbi:uncharacterized protein [Chelonus insularis]|uniref:uncharacterized protein n=1 Tax=Chelonus insularis TaxID=460826 RepID=UPI0015896B00|nr:uncharacterized protein LOC118073741 [Chelonus insularis]